jgi:hypothetical protein
MKHFLSLITASLLFSFTLGAADPPPAKTRPFRGTIKIVNKSAQTIVLRGEKAQTFKIIPETKIRRDGKSITIDEIAVGDTLGGFACQAPAGHWEALTLNFGQKVPEAAGAPSPAPPRSPAAPRKQPSAPQQ